eukprot:4554932-Pleurochrysis_carterae.AAC.2
MREVRRSRSASRIRMRDSRKHTSCVRRLRVARGADTAAQTGAAATCPLETAGQRATAFAQLCTQNHRRPRGTA